MRRALDHGAMGFIPKSADAATLGEAITRVLDGDRWAPAAANAAPAASADEHDAAQRLQTQQRAVEADPSVTNLLALGDTYLGLQMVNEAEATYLRAVNSDEPAPAGIYQRLAVIYLQRDLTEAQSWLNLARSADPNDIDTLFLLGEVSWAINDLPTAQDAYTDFLALADMPEPYVEQRLKLLNRALPLTEQVQADPSKEGLLELAELYWSGSARSRATSASSPSSTLWTRWLSHAPVNSSSRRAGPTTRSARSSAPPSPLAV